jgi:mannitol/fructose-specific phosphotransferase system IIA component (Ntr-type)
MGGICKRLVPECVILDIDESDKEKVFRRLVEALARVHNISDREQLVKDILERETLAPTCLGLGCALPHAHSKALDSTVIAAARLNPPQDPDDEPVSLVFLMAGPEDSAGLHLKLLSKLARLLHNSEFRKQLREAEQTIDFYNLICQRDD